VYGFRTTEDSTTTKLDQNLGVDEENEEEEAKEVCDGPSPMFEFVLEKVEES